MINKQILWTPSAEFIESSNLKAYENWLSEQYGLTFSNYSELWKWSIDSLEQFWESIWKYFNIISHNPYHRVLSTESMPGALWFEGAMVSYSEHLFRHRNEQRPAILFVNEKCCRKVDWKELEETVLAVRQYLLSRGIKKGDRVVAYLPNIPETIAIFIAVNSLGAIWSCCSPDFGVNTVIDRFDQIKPHILFCANGYSYNGKVYSRKDENRQILEAISSLYEMVELPYEESLSGGELWNEILSKRNAESKLDFVPVEFNDPIWVLYSSGTTGKPKAITHSAGGVLIEHLKYGSLHNDVKSGEHFFWFTTTGWMMWNKLQASMLAGAIPVLYDGSPSFGGLDRLWKSIEELPIHHFGTSAPFISASMKTKLDLSQLDCSQLRSIGSTGSPLSPEAFDWIYEHVSKDVWLCSMSGGTDVCTAFVGGTPYLPVYRSAIQCRALGCALKAYDEDGNEVYNRLGEMVIEKPMPSMPIYFWNDEDGEKYHSSYFDHYPGIWRHGDWIEIFDNGMLVIHGRSDATLNRKGVRIGTAEIYNLLAEIEEIRDSLVLNLELQGGDDFMPLFVCLEAGLELREDLQQKIRTVLKEKASPRHVPDIMIQVEDIPYTLSGKKMEVPVKKLLMAKDSARKVNRESIRNPKAMEAFVDMAEAFRKKYL